MKVELNPFTMEQESKKQLITRWLVQERRGTSDEAGNKLITYFNYREEDFLREYRLIYHYHRWNCFYFDEHNDKRTVAHQVYIHDLLYAGDIHTREDVISQYDLLMIYCNEASGIIVDYEISNYSDDNDELFYGCQLSTITDVYKFMVKSIVNNKDNKQVALSCLKNEIQKGCLTIGDCNYLFQQIMEEQKSIAFSSFITALVKE
jgi:hypothetical protein